MDDYNDWQWRRVECKVPYECCDIILYISARPWLMDDYNDWQWRRKECKVPYKCAVILFYIFQRDHG